MSAATNQRTVLLVDDDVVIRNLLRRSLEAAGFSVLAAADANEALAVVRTCSERIQVMLTDIEMPGTDGLTLAEQITCERAGTLVLLMSAGTARIIPEQMAFIAKPFSPTELIAKLELLLGMKRQL
jgi:DNA-binding response OmpR family regulator